MLMTKLSQERLTQAVRSICVCEAAIEWTVDYTSERKAFGGTIADFQNTQFVLAPLAAETTALHVFTDWCIARHLTRQPTPRSDESRVGKECGSTGRSLWWPYH